MKVTLHPLATTDQQNQQTGDVALPIDLALADRLNQSLQRLLTRQDELATNFYDRLFATHPPLRRLFPQDLTAQREKLTATLSWIASHLADRAAVVTAIADLGRRHAGYGAKAEHYPIITEMLVAAMKAVGKTEFDSADEAAWRTALNLIAERMIRAQESAANAGK